MRKKTAAETVPASAPSAVPIDLDHELTKGFTARYIRYKSWQLLGHAGLRKADRPDIEQELLMEVWKALPNFEPEAGDWRSFVATVVERQAAQFLIHRRAEKRGLEHEIESLDVMVPDADGVLVSLASQIGPQHRSAMTGVYPLDELEQVENRMDLETLLLSLTDDERELLGEFLVLSQTEVAALRGVSRRTIRGLLDQTRDRFEQKKLSKFLNTLSADVYEPKSGVESEIL